MRLWAVAAGPAIKKNKQVSLKARIMRIVYS